jgi:hypothetical protein
MLASDLTDHIVECMYPTSLHISNSLSESGECFGLFLLTRSPNTHQLFWRLSCAGGSDLLGEKQLEALGVGKILRRHIVMIPTSRDLRQSGNKGDRLPLLARRAPSRDKCRFAEGSLCCLCFLLFKKVFEQEAVEIQAARGLRSPGAKKTAHSQRREWAGDLPQVTIRVCYAAATTRQFD